MNESDHLHVPSAATMRIDPQSKQSDLVSRIDHLVRERPYGVLCTQSQSQPYGSLVALAATDDLTTFVFATPTTTRKYRLSSLSCCRAKTFWQRSEMLPFVNSRTD